MITFAMQVDSSGLKAKFSGFSEKLRSELVPAIESFLIFLQSYIRANKLSDDPLHRRTGKLTDSINYSAVKQTEHDISGTVGTNLRYGRVHELGGTFNIPEYVRRTSAVESLREMGWSSKAAKGFKFETTVRAHTATYPQRAFLMPSLRENESKFKDMIQEAADKAAHESA